MSKLTINNIYPHLSFIFKNYRQARTGQDHHRYSVKMVLLVSLLNVQD